MKLLLGVLLVVLFASVPTFGQSLDKELELERNLDALTDKVKRLECRVKELEEK